MTTNTATEGPAMNCYHVTTTDGETYGVTAQHADAIASERARNDIGAGLPDGLTVCLVLAFLIVASVAALAWCWWVIL